MGWVSFLTQGQTRMELVIGDGVHALSPGVTLLILLGCHGEILDSAGERAERDPDDILPFASVTMLPPTPPPPSIRDFYGFENHARAGGHSRDLDLPPEWFQIPVFYFTNPASLIGLNAPVEVASSFPMVNYEAEIAAVVGPGNLNQFSAQTGRHIIGYSILNDWSSRDLQRQEMLIGLGPAKGKGFASNMGPYLVTSDELEPFRKRAAYDRAITSAVDRVGDIRGNLGDIHWSFKEMLSGTSRSATLRPGDILGSGTCGTGCSVELLQTHGAERYPWLQPGNRVEVTVDQFGSIASTLQAAAAPHPLRVAR